MRGCGSVYDRSTGISDREEKIRRLQAMTGLLAFSDVRTRQTAVYGTLYLLASSGLYEYNWGPHDSHLCLTPETYRKAQKLIAEGKADDDWLWDNEVQAVRQGCVPSIVYVYDDCTDAFIDVRTAFCEGERIETTKWIPWNSLTEDSLDKWVKRLEAIAAGYAEVKDE